jgi:microcompartment protein CcmK/EutM
VTRGRVLGEVWGTRKAAGLDGRKLVLVVELDGEHATDRVVVAWDTIEARVGQHVLVAFGSGARNVVQGGDNRALVCDAAVSLLIDGEGEP